MKIHPYKKKNKNYKPLEPPPDKKALYKQILTWTRNKQTFWYIGSQEKDYVCYVLQGNDGHKIFFKHYLAKPSHSQYEFVNFPGHYTYKECKALEDAILNAGFKKPLSPSEYRAKQEKERKKEREKELIKMRAEIDRNMRYWKAFKEATLTGKCNWQYVSVSDTSRLFRTVINKTSVTFGIKIYNKKNQPAYRISSPVIKGPLWLENNEGVEFERFLLNHCIYSSSVENNIDCHNKTCEEYYVFKKEQDYKQKQALNKKQKDLYRELKDILLKEYKIPFGDKKIGMAILAEDKSGHLLQTVYSNVLPSSVASFSVSMEWLLDSIDSRYDTTPELRNLYSDILNSYTTKRSQSLNDSVTFPRKNIKKYTKKIKELQTAVVRKENIHTPSNNESTLHSDGIKKKKTKKTKRVNAHDFIIRRSVLSCMYKYHSVINVDAIITVVDRNRDFAELTVPAGYCQQCQKFFILESDYAQITSRGEPLCAVLDEKRYRDNYKNERYFSEISAWPEKSILGKCGYTVSQTTGLSTLERRKILANVIDREILSKIEIRSHLKKQIALHARHPIAVDKWESDEDFVAAYNKGYYAKYGVTRLQRM